MCFLEVVLERCSYVCAPSLHVVCHLVKSETVVIILQLTERSHGSFHIVVDNGESVAVVLKCLPPSKTQVLGIVGKVEASLQHILPAQW